MPSATTATAPMARRIAAVLEYRMREVNRRRYELLAEMQADGQGDLRSLLYAFIAPLADAASTPKSYYLRFLAQLVVGPVYRSTLDWDSASSYRLVWDGLRRRLTDLPAAVVETRLQMVLAIVVHTLAEREHGRSGVPASYDDIVDAAVGLLTAPVTG